MSILLSLVYCEIRKIIKSSVFWVLTASFAILPAISLIKYSAGDVLFAAYLADVLKTFSAILVIGFAFTTCWAFGREYTDKTINDLLVKPVSKLKIATSKFIAISLWNTLLTIVMFIVVVLIGVFTGLTGGSVSLILNYFLTFFGAAVLTMFISTVSAFMANVFKGYLAPIGLIFIIVVIINIVENVGLTAYIPWTIPGILLSPDVTFGFVSVLILTVTTIAGFTGTVAWWRYKEQ